MNVQARLQGEGAYPNNLGSLINLSDSLVQFQPKLIKIVNFRALNDLMVLKLINYDVLANLRVYTT